MANPLQQEKSPDTDTDSPPAPTAFGLPRPPRRGRRLVTWLIVVGVGGGAVAAYLALRDGNEQPVRYKTEPLRRGRLEQAVTATGTVSPLVTVTVGSQVSGRIQEIFVDYNSKVRKGQVVARIDPRLFKTEVDKARANLTAARANLKKAEAAVKEARLQYERDRDLSRQKVVAPAEVETRLATFQSARAQVAAGQAAVEQARAALSQARANLAYTTIVSPIDGVIVSRNVDVGQTVAASLQAPTLFTIAEDLRKMEVHTSVAESDVGQLREGMPVRFTVDAYPDDRFHGAVKQVRYEAETVQNVVTYDAVVSVDNAELKLRPGMTANVSFIVAVRDDVLRVPTAALRFRPSGVGPPARSRPPRKKNPGDTNPGGGEGRRARRKRREVRRVFVLRGGSPVPVRVRTGLSDGSHVEVLGGELQRGDAVIVGVEGEEDGDRPRRRRRRRPRIL